MPSMSRGLSVLLLLTLLSLSLIQLSDSAVASAFTSVLRTNAPRTGQISVTVLGTTGVLATVGTAGVRTGGTGASASVWISTSSVLAKVPMLVGSGLAVTTTVVSGTSGTITVALTSDIFSGSSFVKANSPSTGSSMVTILGGRVGGTASASATARLARTEAAASMWVSDSSLVAKFVAAEVAFSSATVAATAGRQVGTYATTISMDTNLISSQVNSNSPSTAGTTVTLVGRGGNARTSRARLGRSAASATNFISDSSLVLRPASGFATAAVLTASISSSLISLTNALTYNSVSLSNVVVTNAPRTGALSITLLSSAGTNTDPTRRARVSGTAATASVWTSDSAVRARVPSLTRLTSTALAVSNSGTRATFNSAITLNVPATSNTVRTNGPRTGSSMITIVGSNAGFADGSNRVRIGNSAATASSWTSDSTVAGKLPAFREAATQGSIAFTLGVGSVGTATNAFTSDIAVVMSAANGNAPSTGSTSTSIIGAGFGAAANTRRARVAVSGASASVWRSDSAVVGKTVGLAGSTGKSVVVTSGLAAIATASNVVTYNSFSGSSAIVSNVPSTGGVSVTLFGSANLGVGGAARSITTRVSRTAAVATLWISASSLVTKAAALGAGNTGALSVSTGAVGTFAGAVSFNAGTVNTASQGNSPITGAVSVTLVATNSGSASPSPAARLGVTAARITSWLSDSSVAAKMQALNVPSSKVVASVAGSVRSISRAFSSNAFAGVSATVRSNSPITGSVSVTLLGQGAVHVTFGVRIGGSAVPESGWKTDTSIFSKVGTLAVFTSSSLVATVQSVSTVLNSLTYDNFGAVYNVTGYNHPKTGAVSVMVLGSNANQNTYRVRIGGTGATASAWSSSTSIAAKSPAAGMVMAGLVSSATNAALTKIAATLSMAVSYNMAMLTAGGNIPSTGSSLLTLLGSGFGSAPVTAAARIGASGAVATNWQSDSSVIVRPAGLTIPATSPVAVSVAGMATTNSAGIVRANSATISATGPSNSPITGAVSVTLFGSGMGIADASARTRVGPTANEVTQWVSDSVVRTRVHSARFPPNDGAAVVSTVAGRRATVGGLFSYTPAVLGTFSAFTISEGSPFVNEQNDLTASWTASIALQFGDQITISGLTNAATAATTSLPISGTAAAVVSGSIASFSAGNLVITLNGTLAAGTSYTLTFTLQNPSSAAVPNVVTIAGPNPRLITPLTAATTVLAASGQIPVTAAIASNGFVIAPATATTITLTAAQVATLASASIALSDNGAGGVFQPTSVSFPARTATVSFTYTPAAALTDGSRVEISYSETATHCPPRSSVFRVSSAAKVLTRAPSGVGTGASASANIAVSLGQALTGTATIALTVTVSSANADLAASIVVTPPSVTLSASQTLQSFAISQPFTELAGTITLSYTSSSTLGSFVLPPDDIVTLGFVPVLNTNITRTLFLTQSEMFVAMTTAAVPANGISAVWALRVTGPASKDTVVSIKNLELTPGSSMANFTITAGATTTGDVTITFMPLCRASRLFQTPPAYVISIIPPQLPTITFSTGSEPAYTNQVVVGTITLAARLALSRSVTVAVTSSGDVAAAGMQNVVISGGTSAGTFTVTAGATAPGNVTLSYVVSGSGAFGVQTPMASVLPVIAQSALTFAAPASVFVGASSTALSINLASPVAVGKVLNVTITLSGKSAAGSSLARASAPAAPLGVIQITAGQTSFTDLIFTAGTQDGATAADAVVYTIALSGSAAPAYSLPAAAVTTTVAARSTATVGFSPAASVAPGGTVTVTVTLGTAVAVGTSLTVTLAQALDSVATVTTAAAALTATVAAGATSASIAVATGASMSGTLVLDVTLSGTAAVAYLPPARAVYAVIAAGTIGASAAASEIYVGQTTTVTLAIASAATSPVVITASIALPGAAAATTSTVTIATGATSGTLTVGPSTSTGVITITYTASGFTAPTTTIPVLDRIRVRPAESTMFNVIAGTTSRVTLTLSDAIRAGSDVTLTFSLGGASRATAATFSPTSVKLAQGARSTSFDLVAGAVLGDVLINTAVSGSSAGVVATPAVMVFNVLGSITSSPVMTLPSGTDKVVTATLTPAPAAAITVSVTASAVVSLVNGATTTAPGAPLTVSVAAAATSFTFTVRAAAGSIGGFNLVYTTAAFYNVPAPEQAAVVGLASTFDVPSRMRIGTTLSAPATVRLSVPVPFLAADGTPATLSVNTMVTPPANAVDTVLLRPTSVSFMGGDATATLSLTAPSMQVGSFGLTYTLGGNAASLFSAPDASSVTVFAPITVDAPSSLTVGAAASTFTIRLGGGVSTPRDLTVALTSSAGASVTLSAASVAFLPASGAALTFTAAATAALSGNGAFTITYALSGSDASFFDAPAATVVTVVSGTSVGVLAPQSAFAGDSVVVTLAAGGTLVAGDLTVNVAVTTTSGATVSSSAIALVGTTPIATFSVNAGTTAGAFTLAYTLAGARASAYTGGVVPTTTTTLVTRRQAITLAYDKTDMAVSSSNVVTVTIPEAFSSGDLTVQPVVSSGTVTSVRFLPGETSKTFTITAGMSTESISVSFVLSGSRSNNYAVPAGRTITVSKPALSIVSAVQTSRNAFSPRVTYTITLSTTIPADSTITLTDLPGFLLRLRNLRSLTRTNNAEKQIRISDLSRTVTIDTDSTLGPVIAVSVPLARVGFATGVTASTVTVVTPAGETATLAVTINAARAAARLPGSDANMDVRADLFNTKTVTGATNARGARNTITVTLVAAADIEAESQITFSGFDASTSAPSSNLRISGASAADVSNVGTYSQGRVVVVVANTIPTGRNIEFKFDLLNPITAVPAGATVTVTSTGTTQTAAETLTAPNGAVLTGADAPANSPVGTAAQTTTVKGASNTVTISLRPRAELVGGDAITLSGLFGFDTPSNAAFAIAGANAAVFGSAGMFDSAAGTLVLTVAAGQTVPTDANTVITFTAQNAVYALATRTVSATISGAQPGPTTALTGNLLIDANAPSATLSAITCSDTSRVTSSNNLVTIRFRSTVDIVTGSIITVSNLPTTLLTTTGNVPVTSSFASVGTFNQAVGTLTITTTATITRLVQQQLSFTLQLGAAVSAAVTPSIAVATPANVALIAATASTTTCLSAVGTIAAFTTSTITQTPAIAGVETSNVQGGDTIITISVAANIELALGSVITITDLRGASRPVTNANLPLTLTGADALANIAVVGGMPRGAWDLNAGTLSVTLTEGALPVGQTLSFTFPLTNGFPTATPVPTRNIQARATTAATDVIALTTLTNDGTVLRPTLRTWLTATVKQTDTNAACQSCIVEFALQPSTDLAVGDRITVSGILGSQTLNNARLVVDDSNVNADATLKGAFGGVGAWTQATGQLVLTLAKIVRSTQTVKFSPMVPAVPAANNQPAVPAQSTIATPANQPTNIRVSSSSAAGAAVMSEIPIFNDRAFITPRAPAVVFVEPRSGSVSSASAVSFTFDREIVKSANAASGRVSIYRCDRTPAQKTAEIACNTAAVSIVNSGLSLKVDISGVPGVSNVQGLCVYVTVSANCVAGKNAPAYTGFEDANTAKFFTPGGSQLLVSAVSPAAGATVPVSQDRVEMTFTSSVAFSRIGGSSVLILDSRGNIVSTATPEDTPNAPAGETSTISISPLSDKVVVINMQPSVIAMAGETYSVVVPNNLIVSATSGQPYAGLLRNEYTIMAARPAGAVAPLVPALMTPMGVIPGSATISLQLVFVSTSATVTKGTGVISVYRNNLNSDPAIAVEAVTNIDVTSATVTVVTSGTTTTVTIPIDVDLTSRVGPTNARDTRGFSVRVPPGAFVAGTQMTPAMDRMMWTFFLSGAGAPVVQMVSPSKGTVLRGQTALLTATFNKWVTRGNGTVQVRALSDGSVLELFNVLDTNRVTVNGRRVSMTINVPAVPGLELYVAVPAAAFTADGVAVADTTAATIWPLTVFQNPRGRAVVRVDRTLPATTSQALTTEDGSTITFTGASIPAGVDSIQATRRTFTQRTAASSASLTYTPLSDLFDFEPDGVVFTAPVTACLRYDTTVSTTGGSLVLAKQVTDNTGKTVFSTVPGDTTTNNGAVCGVLSGFSSYIVANQVVAPTVPGGPSTPATPGTPATPSVPTPSGPGTVTNVVAVSGAGSSPSSSVPIVPVVLSVAAAVFVIFAAGGVFLYFRRNHVGTDGYENGLEAAPIADPYGPQAYPAQPPTYIPQQQATYVMQQPTAYGGGYYGQGGAM